MNLRYTRSALADLDAVLTYLDERSPQGAKRVQNRIRLLLALLERHPFIGQATSEPGIRRLVVSPYSYLIFYEVADEIVVHAVRQCFTKPFIDAGSVKRALSPPAFYASKRARWLSIETEA